MRVTIFQRVAVFQRDPERPLYMEQNHQRVTDADTLARLHDVVYEDEQFRDFIGGLNVFSSEQWVRDNPNDESAREALERARLENAVASALRPGGFLTLLHKADTNELWVVTEYETNRELDPRELKFLEEYTTGQWSDGIGENFIAESETRYGLIVDCSSGILRGDNYKPVVEVRP